MAPVESADHHALAQLIQQRAIFADLVFHIQHTALSCASARAEQLRKVRAHHLWILRDLNLPMLIDAAARV
jgi:hypothetical protein